MESWEHSTTPMIKFEDSPAESFVSTPGDMYPSLFPESASPNTLDPSNMMSPSSPQDLTIADTDMPLSEASAGDKKGSKKRKSWGQVLPEPKTNLPPRKRAKTEDEKEQRRVERVLRNRRAAQSSRERKRLEVEALEMKNKELETALNHAQQANARLMEELTKFRRGSGAVARSSSPFDSFHNSNSVTLSPELFGSKDGRRPSVADSESTLVDGLMAASKSAATVNPASLSPALTPVPETDETSAQQEAAVAAPSPVALSSDVTQLVGGLADFPAPNMDFVPSASDAHDHFLGGHFSVSEAFDADRYVLESGLLSSPNSVDYDNDIMAGDSSAFASAFSFDIDELSGLLSSPNSVDYDNDIMAGDSSAFASAFNFDMDEFLNDEASAAATDASAAENSGADPDYGRRALNPETQVSSENPNLQPQSGASTYGCDDGGIAVGV
ncbi:Transcriptional activator hac1 like protein [Verticillium longisporum]|uniref:Transcriptional activator hac1 like protein n=1 Tax=Verticillium longisporum TaxID=100787 RepID=A0A8I2ZFT9_VERLO|nr:Transcriptional activator hac1 like protein [Verticillium longisporum]